MLSSQATSSATGIASWADAGSDASSIVPERIADEASASILNFFMLSPFVGPTLSGSAERRQSIGCQTPASRGYGRARLPADHASTPVEKGVTETLRTGAPLMLNIRQRAKSGIRRQLHLHPEKRRLQQHAQLKTRNLRPLARMKRSLAQPMLLHRAYKRIADRHATPLQVSAG